MLTCMLLATLTACGNDDNISIDIEALTAELSGSAVFADELYSLSASKIVSEVKVDQNLYVAENAAFFTNLSSSGEEFGVFECNSTKDAKELVKQLETRRDALLTKYDNYGADAKFRLSNLFIRQKGKYVVYVSADDYAAAAKIVDKYFS